jgi:hypothetical protein
MKSIPSTAPTDSNKTPGFTTAINKTTAAARYDVIREYQSSVKEDLGGVTDRNYIGNSASWAMAVIPLGRPQSFSRSTNSSIGKAIEGGFTRREKPFIITDDCVSLNLSNTKRGHTKTLQATLKHSGVNYLSSDVVLPGDWIFAWCWNNEEDKRRVIKQINDAKSANGFGDGLKFVGRVHNIRKSVQVSPDGIRIASYSIQGIGFEELDTQFFYDFALATVAAAKNDISTFMAQVGLDFTELSSQEQARAGKIKDNCDRLIEALINIILGKGVANTINRPIERSEAKARLINSDVLKDVKNLVAPQANKEAPFAYLVPVVVGTLLGRDVMGKSKSGVFGYADILDTLIGVQRFNERDNNTSSVFTPDLLYPEIDAATSTTSRKKTGTPLKGTFLPVNPSFVNRPLFQLLQQFLNSSINEMYTALRTNENGSVVPTLVVRQIPFSTPSAKEYQDFPLTRFLSMPRWVIDPVMVSSIDIGRSNATRTNMIHVYGEAMTSGVNDSVTAQMSRNSPIFDRTDIQRSGIRAKMQTVNCALPDQQRKDGGRIWMEAIADWTIGSQYTLNGTLRCMGIQSPIVEGDNVEFEDVVYHIEGVNHSCSISPDGRKSFKTSLDLSNGMPKDQSDATIDFPRYPGFKNVEVLSQKDKLNYATSEEAAIAEGSGASTLSITRESQVETVTVGDSEIASSQDPGHTFEG